MQKSKGFMQHGTTSIYDHSVSVAVASIMLARAIGLCVDERALVRGALLHDYFLYDWHNRQTSKPKHATKHGSYAPENAQQDFELGPVECDMIAKHMFPLSAALPRYRETWVLCVVDKWVSLRETALGAMGRLAG